MNLNNPLVGFMPVLASLFLLVALSGCATRTKTDTLKTQIHIPPQSFVCEDSGPRPQGTPIMESQVAKYITELEYSNKDCKTKLKELKILITCYNDSNCNVDKIAEYIGLVNEAKER